ncbi:hypothetical protein ACWD34_01425, partial [Streptomyces sp. NPDC002611]
MTTAELRPGDTGRTTAVPRKAEAEAVPAEAGAVPGDAEAVPAEAGAVPGDAEAVPAEAGAV